MWRTYNLFNRVEPAKEYEFKRGYYMARVIREDNRDVSVAIRAFNEDDAHNRIMKSVISGCKVVDIREARHIYKGK